MNPLSPEFPVPKMDIRASISRRQSLGFDVANDDSSSINSMDSSSKQSKCRICKDPETLPTNPLVSCSSCHGLYHPTCNKPFIDTVNEDSLRVWQCKRCLKKKFPITDPSSTPTPPFPVSMSPKNSSNEPARSIAGTLCETAGCGNFVAPFSDSTLCYRHKTQLKHRSATTVATNKLLTKTSIGSKKFQKSKMYPSLAKLDDNKKSTKRKRPDSSSTIFSYSIPPQVDATWKSSGSMTNKSHIPRTSSENTPRTSIEHEPWVNTTLYDISIAQNTTQSSSNEKMLSSNEGRNSSYPKPGSKSVVASFTPLNIVQNKHIFSDLSPPNPPPANNIQNQKLFPQPQQTDTVSSTRIDTLFSSFSSHERLTKAAHPQATPYAELQKLPDDKISGVADQNTTIAEEIVPICDEISLSRNAAAVESGQKVQSKEMIVDQDTGVPEIYHEAARNISLASRHPTVTDSKNGSLEISEPECHHSLPINHTMPTLQPNYDPTQDPKETITQSSRQNPNEDVISFDPTILDFFLAKQREPISQSQPSQEQLSKQIWGHIDPRTQWPNELSEEWLAEKRREIDARGGRKANFGKLLTAQVVKERRDNGWGVHQNKEIDEEKRMQTARHCEELFGIKGIDDLVPGVRDGQLVMMEKLEGGRRKKNPKIYPVG